MSDPLIDPNKPPHAIVEKVDDGDAMRNDRVRLGAANKNPWYVLATVFGEQATDANPWGYDEELAARNRRAWNGWFCGGLDDAACADRAEKTGLTVDDLAPLTKSELTEIRERFAARMQAAGIENAELPDPAENILFSHVHVLNFLNFKQFVFGKSFDFSKSHCSGDADFISATFTGTAYFISATFTGTADFSSATFKQLAKFSSAKFKSTTGFKNAKFITHVPEFHAAELYEDTDFTLPEDYRQNWPPLMGEGVMEAARQKKAYNRLRLYMNKSLQIDEEQFFHRMEMRCKRETEGWRYRWIYSVFEAVSDYGNSVLRPAGCLFVLWLVGAICKLELVKGAWWPDYHSIPQAAGWSFANLFPFFGFRRLYFDESLTASLKFIGGGQTVFGFILLFFLALGLRNRFRLR